jgi:apolipoprotein N-acyltransferase
MQKVKDSFWLGPVISGVLTFIAVGQINYVINWICYIPLFISIINSKPRQAFKRGFVFGLALSCLGFFWMIPGAERFTGNSIMYGIGVFLVSAFLFSLYHGAILWCFTFLKNKKETIGSVAVNSMLIAGLYTLAEVLLSVVSAGLPWFDLHSGGGLAASDYFIQPAAVFGMHILSFIIVLVNYLSAYFIARRLWIKLYIPAASIAVFLLTGYLMFANFKNKAPSEKPFTVAILAENIAPEMKWDANTGNQLVQELLSLNRTAVALKPNMALWSESAVPWTYNKEDDFVKEILSITAPAQVTHVLGINTAYKDNVVFNSAYCLLPGGQVSGRYDKQYLLSFIEKPLSGIIMPFFSSSGFSATSDDKHGASLTTPYGKAGVFICNEAAVPAAAASKVKDGAQFLFNMSNDGWFNDTYIVRLHFYYARLRAVESRKDLAINSNNGYSGLVKASGEIVDQERSEDSFVKMVTMQPNSIITMASSFPNLFVYGCAIYILVIGGINLFAREKKVQ